MNKTPYLYKRNAEAIIYHIQSKLQVHLSDEIRHDIYTNVRQAVEEEAGKAREWANNWHKEYVELRKKGYPLKWNELRIRTARLKQEPVDPNQILQWMHDLDEERSIR